MISCCFAMITDDSHYSRNIFVLIDLRQWYQQTFLIYLNITARSSCEVIDTIFETKNYLKCTYENIRNACNQCKS